MTNQLETLIVERKDGVVTVIMNRPERKNAANGTMWRELLATFDDVATDRNVRVMVLTGAGGAFCSGADLGDAGDVAGRPGDPYLVQMRALGDVALRLHRIPKPTIAKVGGVAAGAGMSMALGCDLVVASDSARFSQIFSRRGLSVDFGASWLLPRLVGLHRAKELAFFADIISAQQAAEFGVVNKVVPDDHLDAFVAEWADRLAAGPPLALSMTKTMLNNSVNISMDQALEEETRSQSVNFGTADTAEAIAAFTQKREPKFEGR
ncbi:MAG TPA: enoyl-CoA hydratase [Acidimicrobiales bacterium]|jgi:enoyl-CoA hydratase/carnithine racemase|nr:enoyl-CoA hydratase [Acidimicrobiales bacterium]